jgi:type IV pilus assembly protein PilP
MNRRSAIFLLVLTGSLLRFEAVSLGAEEGIQTPSGQMKEAVDKLNQAPATIGKSLQGLTDAAKGKLQQTFGSKAKADSKTEPVDLELPKKTSEAPAAAPALKPNSRDPFRPTTLRTRVNPRARENLSPLEQRDLSQLKLVGIIWDIKEPIALVEDTTGLGFTLKVGTPVGINGGKVKAIHRDQIIVEEYCEDAYGVQKMCQQRKGLPTEQ